MVHYIFEIHKYLLFYLPQSTKRQNDYQKFYGDTVVKNGSEKVNLFKHSKAFRLILPEYKTSEQRQKLCRLPKLNKGTRVKGQHLSVFFYSIWNKIEIATRELIRHLAIEGR